MSLLKQVWWHISFNPDTWETEGSRFLRVSSQPGLHIEFQASQNSIVDPASNKQTNENIEIEFLNDLPKITQQTNGSVESRWFPVKDHT